MKRRTLLVTGQFPDQPLKIIKKSLRERGFVVPEGRWVDGLDAVIAGKNPGKAAATARTLGIPVLGPDHLASLLAGEPWFDVVPGGDPDVLAALRERVYVEPSRDAWDALMHKLETCPAELRPVAVDYIVQNTAHWPRVSPWIRGGESQVRPQILSSPWNDVDSRWLQSWSALQLRRMALEPEGEAWRLIRTLRWPQMPAEQALIPQIRLDGLEALAAVDSVRDRFLIRMLKAPLPSLETLRLSTRLDYALEIFQALADHPGLRRLHLSNSDDHSVTDTFIAPIAEAFGALGLTGFSCAIRWANAEHVARLVSALPGLRALRLIGGQADARELSGALDKLDGERLTHLRLSLRGAQNWAEVVFGAKHLRALESLVLSGPFSEAGLGALGRATHLGRVRELSLLNSELSDAGARALARLPHLNRLVGLTLSHSAISAVGLGALLSRAGRLEVLGLFQTRIDDIALDGITVAPCAQHLRLLNVKGCHGVTESGLWNLLRSGRLPKLEVLVAESRLMGERVKAEASDRGVVLDWR